MKAKKRGEGIQKKEKRKNKSEKRNNNSNSNLLQAVSGTLRTA